MKSEIHRKNVPLKTTKINAEGDITDFGLGPSKRDLVPSHFKFKMKKQIYDVNHVN